MTLHQTTEFFHKFLKWSLILGSLTMALILVFNITKIIFKILYPPPPDYPTVAFGKLPPVTFPKSTVNESFTYTINTLTGTLPSLPDRVKIFKHATKPVTLLNVQNARDKVAQLGFMNGPEKQFHEFAITPTRYQWQVVTNGLLRTIIMNTDTYDFRLTSTYRTYPPILNQSLVASDDNVKNRVIDFLTDISLLSDDIDMEKAKITPLTLKSGILLPAENVSSTQVFRIDIFQKDVEKLPIFYPTYPQSSIYFLMMARANNIDDVLEANFYHQATATESATYPIKTAQEAFEDLKAGKGYVANYYGTTKDIQITDITLGYYVGEERLGYLLPVIMFQSKEEYFAFVPAIKEACLNTSDATLDECQGKLPKK